MWLKPKVFKYQYFKYHFFLFLIPKTIEIIKTTFSKQNLLCLHVKRKILQLSFLSNCYHMTFNICLVSRLRAKVKRFAVTFLFLFHFLESAFKARSFATAFLAFFYLFLLLLGVWEMDMLNFFCQCFIIHYAESLWPGSELFH